MKFSSSIPAFLFLALSATTPLKAITGIGEKPKPDSSETDEKPATAQPPATEAPATAAPLPAAKPKSAKPAEKTDGAAKVKVGMFLKNISKFDAVMGKYTAEFDLEFSTPEDAPAYDGNFDLWNGRILKKEVLKSENASTKRFKVEAEIDLDLDFKRFPWDNQDLSITLYNPEMDSKLLEFEVDPLTADESAMDEKVKVIGWEIEENLSVVSSDALSDANEKYSNYTFGITIDRMRYASSMKVFFPLTIMLFISFLALFVGAAGALNRLTIVTGTLLAAVMFHLNASGALPPIGYLTLADKVFFCSYVSFLINLIFTVAVLKFNETKQEAKVSRTLKLAGLTVPTFTVVTIGLALAGII